MGDPAVYSPARLLAEVLLRLHELGVSTGTAGADALAATAELLRALAVDPVDGPLLTQYRVRLVDAPHTRCSALAANEDAAMVLARAWRALPDACRGRAAVLVEPVTIPAPGVAA